MPNEHQTSAVPSPIKTTCAYCGVGCGVLATPSSTETYAIEVKGDPEHPANFGTLCSKGSALGETVNLDGRCLHPQIEGEITDWETALTDVASRFQHCINTYGPESVALYVSGQLLTEDYYVANKFMKGGVGTANIDTNSRLCMSAAVAGHKRAFGADMVPACYDDLAAADLVVLVGANTAWTHPIVFKRIQERRDEKTLIVIDPRKSPTAEQADLHLPIKPGSDVLLFNGLLVWLDSRDALDRDYIAEQVDGFTETLKQARLDAPTTDVVASDCDVAIEDLEDFYTAVADTEKTVTMFSMGVNQSSQGADKVNAIINVHLATGRVGKPGASPFSITGQPNAMGGREVGGLANMLAAHMDFDQADVLQEFWQSSVIARQPGLKAVDLFDAVYDGTIKAIWIMGTNPAVSLPNANKVREALARCEHVIVSDCMQNTDTTASADVLLPATGWGEKDGTVTNSERRISRQRAIMPAAGEAKHDWWIISQVAQRLGFNGFDYQHQREIFAEHAALSAYQNTGQRDFDIGGLADLSAEAYEQLQPVQWPVRTKGDSTPRLGNGKVYTPNERAQCVPVSWQAPPNQPTPDCPLVLNSGRLRDHWHTMTRTGKSPRLSSHIVEAELAIHPADAEQRDITDRCIVQLSSQWGQATVRAKITNGQRKGELFLPIHWTDQYAGSAIVGKVVNPIVDSVSGEPGFKHTPVEVKPVTMDWYGFVLTHAELPKAQLSLAGYWTKVHGQQFYRYEIVGTGDPQTLLQQLLPQSDLQYSDEASGVYRAASITKDQSSADHLQTLVFISTNPDLPDRSWLSSLFSQPLDAAARSTLLLGESPDPAAEVGPIVCSCFGVGKNTICQAITEQQLTSVAAVGKALKAGTNCGSCQPEIAALLDQASPG